MSNLELGIPENQGHVSKVKVGMDNGKVTFSQSAC